MALITRQGKGSRLTIQEMDNNLLYLEGGSLSTNPFIRTLQVCGGDFNLWLDKMDEGFIFTQDEVDGPDDRFYGISSVETWYETFNTPNAPVDFRYKGVSDVEVFMSTSKVRTLPTNYFASVETYAKTSAQYQYSLFPYTPENLPIRATQDSPDLEFLNKFFGGNGFESAFLEGTAEAQKRTPYTVHYDEILDLIMDRGVIEKGKIKGESQIDMILSSFEKKTSYYKYRFPLTLSAFTEVLLDTGVFVVNFDAGAKLDLYDSTNGGGKESGILVASGRGLRRTVIEEIAVPA